MARLCHLLRRHFTARPLTDRILFAIPFFANRENFRSSFGTLASRKPTDFQAVDETQAHDPLC